MGLSPIDAAVAAAEALPPREGLEAVTALRARLDSLESRHVENAIRAGCSWRQVADSLGVTKQAAHKKHARRVAEKLASEAAAKRKRLIITGQARASVRLAREEARSLGAASLREEHLVLGLLRDAAGSAREALAAAGLTLAAAREAARALADGEDESVPPGSEPLPVAPGARSVLENSLREAVRRRDGHLGVEHLLLAVLHADEGRGVRLLEFLGVEPRTLERRLDEALAEAV